MIPKIVHFLDYNLNLHQMIDMHSKYDNMHKNEMFYALICINNHVIACYHPLTQDIHNQISTSTLID